MNEHLQSQAVFTLVKLLHNHSEDLKLTDEEYYDLQYLLNEIKSDMEIEN